MPHHHPDGPDRPTRRRFLQSAALTASAAALPAAYAAEQPAASAPAQVPPPVPARPVRLHINGKEYALSLEPRVTLLDALREVVGLTGAKKGCDHGQCGACTVLSDGRRINACLTLAVMQEGRHITTIEGLADGETLHPMQAAFVARDALQCGFCTPGQICSAVGMLAEARAGAASTVQPPPAALPQSLSDAEIRERMSGNICRCGAYQNIVAAVRDATGAMRRS
ncbi:MULTISPECIES: (2Fe-2S)-binding protein [Cupriavidus]|uniref:Twin-arginine translocation pathway signal n=1 Tax=Cupriavidus pinatubonensis (strain JMP 134 / LMG 1197) TaxID=264198 RepID=Q46SM9_CUPPJ|nr:MULTISPECIES: 2Fe-2S iron-sulfur cluster-binding protein [Cupriavidus]TPQ36358.1 (2Fe-2S)-binding protein [Cupriavidus pinatubonensis]